MLTMFGLKYQFYIKELELDHSYISFEPIDYFGEDSDLKRYQFEYKIVFRVIDMPIVSQNRL